MTEDEISKPTKQSLVNALSVHYGIDTTEEAISDELYLRATDQYDRLSLRTMAAKLIMLMNRKTDQSSSKHTEYIETSGYLVGSRDFTTKKSVLGRNKVQHVAFLEDQGDGTLKLFTEPNAPTAFKDFPHQVTGKHVSVQMKVTKSDRGTFVTPTNIKVIDDAVLDTSKIVTSSLEEVSEMDDYSPCAISTFMRSIWPMRVPVYDQDKYETEEFPQLMNGNPVFTFYTAGDESGIRLTSNVQPTHLSSPYITLEDFDILYTEDCDFEYDLHPAIAHRGIVIIGQKRRTYEYNDILHVEIDVNAILETGEHDMKTGDNDITPTNTVINNLITICVDNKTTPTVETIRGSMGNLHPDISDDDIQACIDKATPSQTKTTDIGETPSWF